MKERELLDIVFEDAEAFREESLRETLRAVRDRRRARRAGQWLVIVCVLALLTVWWAAPGHRVTPVAVNDGHARRGFQIVHSRALPPERIVQSSINSFQEVFGGFQSVALIETKRDAAQFAELQDEELLALIPGEPKLLVWRAPHDAELLFLGP